MTKNRKEKNQLANILFDTLAYIDKISGRQDSYYIKNSSVQGEKPDILVKGKPVGFYSEKVNGYLEVMYRFLLDFNDSVVSEFFRIEVDTKNFLVWLRCKENAVSWDEKIIKAGDWHLISTGQGMDMGYIPNRFEIAALFQKGEWDALVSNLFFAWQRRLQILASSRRGIVDMLFAYLREEESRWKIKAS